MNDTRSTLRYPGFRFPAEIIGHAVWLDHPKNGSWLWMVGRLLGFSTFGCGSAGREAWGRAQLTALKENLEGSREDSPPALQARQLLRSFCELA